MATHEVEIHHTGPSGVPSSTNLIISVIVLLIVGTIIYAVMANNNYQSSQYPSSNTTINTDLQPSPTPSAISNPPDQITTPQQATTPPASTGTNY